MTRPSRSALVLDGNDVKVRLQAERTASKSPVHIDWVRFTCYLRNAPVPTLEQLFPKTSSVWDPVTRMEAMQKVLATIPDPEFSASTQALNLAEEVAQALGPDFTVNYERRKGHDFYRFRWSIERNGAECGWVGFLSSGESPRQQAQSRTIHCNLFGSACTFADHGWNHRLAALVDQYEGDLTRCDLALDFFDGLTGGIEGIRQNYLDGLCDVGGKGLKCNMVGDWCNGQERSFYFGSKEAGKQTNAYEKGDQLFGPEAGSPWLRVELRYGNKLRELSQEMLRRPADFFAGASEWHAFILAKADAVATPEPVKCTPRLALETVAAEAARSLRWVLSVAGPSIANLVKNAPEGAFLEMAEVKKKPGRLRNFSDTEIARAMARVWDKFSTSEGHSPAFA